MSSRVDLLLSKKKHTMHLLHAILTLFTGVWAIVWLCAHIANSLHNRKIDSQIEERIRWEERNV